MDSNDVREILGLGADFGKKQDLKDSPSFIVVDEGKKVEHLPRPDAVVKESIRIGSAKSAVDYVDRFKNNESVAFVDSAKSTIQYVLDYHTNDAAGRSDHIATLCPQESDQFKTWQGREGEGFNQVSFAEFLEDNEGDLSNDNDAACKLREAVLAFSAVKNAKFESKVNITNGDLQFVFHEETKGGGTVTLPENFKINVPIYEGGPIFIVSIRLRFRINDGKLVFIYKLANMKASKRKAFNDMVEESEKGTGIPHYMGSR